MKKPGTEIIVFSILAIAFIFVSIFFWITYSNEKITERESKDVSTSLAILRNVENIFTDAQHLEIGYTTFIITGKESSLEPFNMALQKSAQDMAGLQDASSKDSVRKADAKQLCNLFTEQILFGKNVVQTRRTKGMNAAIRMAIGENGKQLPDEIHRLTGKIEERERPVLRSENASQPERAGKTMLHFIILTIVFSIFLVAGFIFIGKDLAKNKLLGNQLIQLNRNLSEQVRIKTLEATEVFNRVSDAIIALDHHWCYTYINKKAGLFSNKPVEELIGKNIWVVFPEIVNHEFHKACIQAMESQQYISIEDYYSSQDRWFTNHIYPSSRGLTIYFNDITERKKEDDRLKKNEEKFRALIEHSNDAISIVNEKGEIVYRSPAAEKITGFTLEEVAGKKSIDFVHPDDRENVLEFYRDMEKEPGCSRKKEHRLLHKDG
ncbi:MAG: PAS domain S-box protein, partial [Bacteroidetes bacterium]|nr:PAS domain S-box protein [Bacteroidota bacterium]